MASLLSWLGNTAGKVERQVNPFDHGATASRPAPRPAPAPVQRPQFSQQAQQAIMRRNPGFGAQQIRRGPVIPHYTQQHFGVLDKLGSVPDSLNQALNTNIAQPFITRPAAEVVQSARDVLNHGKPAVYHPQSTSSNSALRLASRPLAAGEAALSVANDVPVFGGLLKGGTKVVKSLEPTFAGLKAGQVIMDTKKLDALHNYLQPTTNVHTKQSVIDGLHQIKQDHGLDFITGSPESRRQRISQYLEQNGEAIPKLQAHQQKMANVRNTAIDVQNKFAPGLRTNAVNDAGESLGMNGKPLKAPVTSTKLVPPAETPVQISERLHQEKLAKNGLTQNEYAAMHDKVSELDAKQSELHKKVGEAFDAEPRKADGTFVNPDSPNVKKAIDAWGKSLDDHRNALNAVRKVDGLEPIVAGERSKPKPLPKTASASPTKPIPVPKDVAPQTPKVTTKLVGVKPERGALPNTNTKQTKFTATLKDSPEVSKPVAKKAQSTYESDTMAAAHERAIGDIQKNGVKKSLDQTMSELNAKRGTASRDTLARAIELAKIHDAKGGAANEDVAARLYELAGEHGSASGQQSQILAAIARRSPAGLRNKAFRDLKEAGIDVNKPENAHIKQEIQGHITAISKMKDGSAKDLAIAVLQKVVAKHLPQSAIDRGVSLWKAGLLSGVKTQQGNAISNSMFGGLKKISDVPAAIVDKGISLGTKTRTKTLTGQGIGSGTKEGAGNGVFTMKSGIDKRSATDKYEQHAEINFNNKVMQTVLAKPANFVFRGMNAADQPFWYASLKNSLYDQAKADGLNRGLSGKALQDHMNKTVANPTEKMADVATREANKSTLNYDTIGSKAIQAAHKGIDQLSGITPAGSKIAHSVLNVIAPFVRVPSAFLSRTVDFTPFGVGKEVFHQVAGGKFDQRALSQAIGEGITGTGVLALGVALTQHKLLSGDYPKNDPKEAQRWKAEGITPNSVKLGGKWINLNYMGPIGLLFNAGNKLENAKGDGQLAQAGAAIGGLGQGLLGQSFLQGFSGFSDAINDPNRNLKKFVNSQVASIVPNISSDIANVTDSMQRQADTPGQSIANKIPGLRHNNPVKQDVYGNPLKQPGGQLNTLVGWKPSNSLTNTSPAIAEVSRLHNVNPNDSNLQVTPTPVGKSITVEKTNVPLNDKQRYALQTAVGKETQAKWNDLIKTPEYKAMDDTQKAAALGNIRSLATEDATRAYVAANNLGTYNKPESAKAAALHNGDDTVANLSQSKATGGTSSSDTSSYYKSPDAEYKALLASSKTATYNSPAKRIEAQSNLAKAKVGSAYDKSIRDLYERNANQVYDYVSTDPNGKAIVDKLLAYSQALKDAGITSSAKFMNKYGQVTLGKASGGSSSSGRRRSSGRTAKVKTFKPIHISVASKSIKAKSVKAPSFKAKRSAIPKLAKVQTPKVTKKKVVA